MYKSTVTMMNWELYVYRGRYRLSGTADHHPVLGRNAYIAQTSDLVSSKWENDVLFYETRNTIYQCPLKYMSTSPYGNVVDSYKEKLSHLDEESDSVLDKIIAAAAKIATGKTDEFAEDILRRTEEGKKELEKQIIRECLLLSGISRTVCFWKSIRWRQGINWHIISGKGLAQ